MTDEELIARLRDCGNGVGSFKTNQGDYGLCDDAADRIEALVKEVERNAAIAIRAMERATLAEEWSKHDKSRAERLEAALRETTQVLRQCTFQYIRVEGQYLDREEVVSRADAALKGADHE